MFGIGDHKGVVLPALPYSKPHIPDNKNEELTISGSKPQEVNSYNHNRNLMLPHISQKSQRQAPHRVYNVYSIKQTEGSMLEAIEIYKRRTRASYSPDRDHKKESGSVIFQSVPCPTPAERVPTTISEEDELPPLQVEVVEDKKENQSALTVMRHPTKLLPVTISLQKRLEKLAKHKSSTNKSQSNSKTKNSTPRFTVKNNHVLPKNSKDEHTTQHLHYTFNSRLLPKITRYPPKSKISYQLLEIPPKLSKPEKKQRTMFSHTDYDIFQHNKFGMLADKKLSIVEGPNSELGTVWDYNKFLYLNVKI